MWFGNALDLLDNYNQVYDLILMDIEMPYLDGMSAAKKLREKDEEVVLVFITNMAQYTIRGYEVDSMDFIVKPVGYYNFSAMLSKAKKRIERKTSDEISIKSATSGIVKLRLSDINYVEIVNHRLIYHTESGNVESWGTLSEAEMLLPKEQFAKCSISYLINLRNVKSLDKNVIRVGNDLINISRGKKSAFLGKLNNFLGG